MTALAVQVLLWIVVGAILIGAASYLAHRSYRRFLRKACGPASQSLGRSDVATQLGTLLDPLEARNPGQSGLATLLDNSDAFAARALSAAQAGRSLDLMYYIWRTDVTGWLLVDALVAAGRCECARVRSGVSGADRAPDDRGAAVQSDAQPRPCCPPHCRDAAGTGAVQPPDAWQTVERRRKIGDHRRTQYWRHVFWRFGRRQPQLG